MPRMLFLLFMVFSTLGIAGCSRSTVSTRFQAPEFSLAEFRAFPSLLIVEPEVRVHAFKKPYGKLFKDTASLSARLSRKILDSLNLEKPMTAVSAGPDSALKKRLAETGARHVVSIRTVTIEDTAEEMDDVLLPGIGGMQPSRGGITKSCILTLDVEILDTALAKRYAFTVHTKANIVLYAYKSALSDGLDAAATKIALHLRGPKPDSAISRLRRAGSLPFYKSKNE